MIAGKGFKDEMGIDLKEIHSICKNCLSKCKKPQFKKYVWLPSECSDFIKKRTMMKGKDKSKIARVRNDGRWHNRGSDWATPQDLYDQLNKEFNFNLDPCASDWNAKCEDYFTEKEDGLSKSWEKNRVFMNPPYGKVLKDWMKKAYESSLKGAVVVCLVPASTDTSWWHDYALKGIIRYLRGRPRFITKEGTWQQTFSPSVIVVFDFHKEG